MVNPARPLENMTAQTMKAITLPCPKCGEENASIAVHLWTLDDETAVNFFCHECEAEISLQEVRGLIARWSRLLDWLETAPTV